MAETETAETTNFEEVFQQQPRAQVPAEIQQVVMDERPRGAISVHVKRDLSEVLKQLRVIATAAGDDFFYSWPTKNKDGSTGVVEGPSVKCANAVARIYGNCTVKVRTFDQGTHWIFYAQFYDLETGFVYERPFQQRKAQNIGGKMDKDRATDIVFQIGASKAARNAVCNALSEFTDFAFAVAKEQLVAKIGKNLDKFRAQVIARLAELKVDVSRVEQIRGKVAASWLAPDVAKVIAEIQGVNDGMAHPDELWPPIEAGAPRPQPSDFKPAAAEPGQAPAADKRAPEGPKTDGQPAASPGPQAGAPDPVTQEAVARLVETGEKATQAAQAGAQGGAAEEAGQASQADGDGPSPAEEALDRGTAIVQRGIDNLQALRTADEIDKAAPSIVEILGEIEGLDPEDLALLKNRWITAQLERKREIGRKAKRK